MTEITVPATGDQPPQVIEIPDRSGVSPIGTTSPNSGATAATNSTYAVGAYTSGITNQTGATSYVVQDTDYQGIIQFNSSSAIAVTLNSNVRPNFSCTILNFGTGAITLTTSDSSLINQGGASLALGSGQGAQVGYANRAWTAFVGTQVIQIVPETLAVVAGVYVTGYNATTGAWTVSSPAGISATITTAKLTTGGTNGSMTFANGALTAQTPAT